MGRYRMAGQALYSLWVMLRRAYNGDALLHGGLVTGVRVHVPAAHETGLRWMRVYPSNNDDILLGDKVPDGLLVCSLTGVGRALLLGDEERVDEESVVHHSSTQQATRLDVVPRIGLCNPCKRMSKRRWQKYWPQRGTVFKKSLGRECDPLLPLHWLWDCKGRRRL